MQTLPSFIVIGAGKSGTTSLHQYLRQHPNILLPTCKETNFFILDGLDHDRLLKMRNFENKIFTLDAYLAEFEHKTGGEIYGEVCPSYLSYAEVAAVNIQKRIPDCKLIAILRNPVEKLYSAFSHANRHKSVAGRDFDVYLNHAMKGDVASMNAPGLAPEFSLYHKKIMAYYVLFGAERIKVFLYEDLLSAPDTLMGDLLKFIQAPDFKFDMSKKFNLSGQPRFPRLSLFVEKNVALRKNLKRKLPLGVYQFARGAYEKYLRRKEPAIISPAARERLKDYYSEDILRLQTLLGRDLSGWLS